MLTMARRATVFLLSGLLLTACSAPWSASGRSHQGGPGMLNWFNNTGNGAWVTTLDPAVVTDPTSISDITLINANLVRVREPDQKIVPDLATWTVSADRLVWTFHIRPNARFSNGDPVTASDAAWSITRALLPATRSTVAVTYLGHILGAADVATGRTKTLAGLRVVDAKTLQVTLDSPIAYFLPALSYPTADVLDRRVLDGQPAGSYLTNKCAANVGAGPFMLVCHNQTSSRSSFYNLSDTPALDFRPNPHYYGKRPRLRIHAPFVTDSETAWAWYTSGKLDGTVVPGDQLGRARSTPGFVRSPLLQTDFITPNSQIPPFDNLSCRLAVAYAINRPTVTRNVLNGMEGPLYDVLPPGLPGYFGKEPDVPSYNPAKARSYLARCPGRLNGVVLTYDGTTPAVGREYRAIRRDLAAIGAHITLKPLGFHAWLNVIGHTMMRTRQQEQITENLWIADYPDPQDWCDTLLHSGGNFDVGGFNNPTYDRLVDEANVEPDQARRARLYEEAQKIALRQGAWISVGYGVGTWMVAPDVHGMVASPNGVWPRDGDWSRVSIAA